MAPPFSPGAIARLRLQDQVYHELRVLILVTAVSNTVEDGALDGLGKLAKLDFLVRYPALIPRALPEIQADDPRLHASNSDHAIAASPLIRYRYGPWDERYYSVVGALVGRGLIEYVPGQRGSIALRPTHRGRALAAEAGASAAWESITDRCALVSEHAGNLSGHRVAELIRHGLPGIDTRPHGEAIPS